LASFVVGGDFARAKGLVEAVGAGLGLRATGGRLDYRPLTIDLLTAGRAAEVVLERSGRSACRVAVLGEVSAEAAGRFGLVGPTAVAELRLDFLEFAAAGERPLVKPSDFPAMQRDVNLVVDDAVRWSDVEAAIRSAAGGLLEDCRLVQVWQDAERLGPGRKSLVVALGLRSSTGTLSGDEAGRVVDAVVESCGRAVQAVLRR
jgi:phenylalanyl-tRNA synthetase beta chain